MTVCWILYDREDLEGNRFFAEELRGCGEELGMDASIVTTDSMSGVPDVVVSRQRDWRISEGLEEGGAEVFNSSRVCRVCNDKLETYRMAERLGIPYLGCSVPGEEPPPGPPWVVKTRSGHGGTGVRMTDSLEGIPDDCLIQEMAGTPGRDMRAYVLDGEVIGCVMRSSDTDFRANVSLGGRAEACEPPEECLGIIEKVVAELDPLFIGVDFVFGDGVYLNEVEDVAGTRTLYALGSPAAPRLMRAVQSKSSL